MNKEAIIEIGCSEQVWEGKFCRDCGGAKLFEGRFAERVQCLPRRWNPRKDHPACWLFTEGRG